MEGASEGAGKSPISYRLREVWVHSLFLLHFPKLIRLSGSLCSNTLEVVTVEEQTRSSERKKRSLAKGEKRFRNEQENANAAVSQSISSSYHSCLVVREIRRRRAR